MSSAVSFPIPSLFITSWPREEIKKGADGFHCIEDSYADREVQVLCLYASDGQEGDREDFQIHIEVFRKMAV